MAAEFDSGAVKEFRFFSGFMGKIDEMLAGYVAEAVSTTIASITPVVSVLMAIWFLFYGLLVIRGAVQMPLMDFVWRSFRIALIVGIALGSGLYQQQWATTLVQLPESLTVALVPSDHSSHAPVAGQSNNIADQALGRGINIAHQIIDKASVWKPSASFGYILLSIGVIGGAVLFAGLGIATITVCKVAVGLLAGLGPLFIIALLFDATRQFFDRWAGQIITYALSQALVMAVFGFLSSLYLRFAEAIQLDGTMNLVYSFTGLGLLSFVSLVVLLKIPSMAGALGGGVAVAGSGLGGAVSFATKAIPIAGAAMALGRRFLGR